MKNRDKKQILVCGTNYAQAYLHAIDYLKEYEVSALLARGSERSVRLSEQRAIKLYQSVAQIDVQVDLACVAIGGDVGASVASELIKREVPVLLEHPVSIENIRHLLLLAKDHDTLCHVNSHFPGIKPVASFIEICKQLNRRYSPRVIHAACNSRTLYSMLDILQRCFGEIDLEQFTSSPMGKDAFYENCSFLVNGTPCALVYQRWIGLADDSKDSPLGHEITITYPSGVLRLGGTFGPCQWFPLVAGGIPQHVPIVSDSDETRSEVNRLNIIQWRIVSNQEAIKHLHDSSLKPVNSDVYQSREWLENLCSLWSLLHNRLGVVPIDVNYDVNNIATYTCIDAILQS